VLWNELEVDLDRVMLATGGVWLECIADAVRTYGGLLTTEGLKSARRSSAGVALIGYTISRTPTLLPIRYQRAGKRLRPQRALTLLPQAAARAWLEERLGPLARFEIERVEQMEVRRRHRKAR
jgi:hypothetical protein